MSAISNNSCRIYTHQLLLLTPVLDANVWFSALLKDSIWEMLDIGLNSGVSERTA